MQKSVDELARRVVDRFHSLSDGERILVGVAGVPGSGKSTLAFPLVDRINELLGVHLKDHAHIDPVEGMATKGEEVTGQVAISVSLDGWHHTRAELAGFKDPEEARRRRGAAFTFDVKDYNSFVLSLRQSPPPPAIEFKTFSHALKDPEPGLHPITPQHRIIVLEGLYVLLNVEPWTESISLLDEKVWVECAPDVARARLVARHLAEGVESTREAAEYRVDKSDMLNGEYIRENLATPTFTVRSEYDPTFAAAALGKDIVGK